MSKKKDQEPLSRSGRERKGSEKTTEKKAPRKTVKTKSPKKEEVIEFEASKPEKSTSISSPSGTKLKGGREAVFQSPKLLVEEGLIPAAVPDQEGEEPVGEESKLSPLFRKLADPVMPDLPKENRARLQMQSPTRLYFYWSIQTNPYKTLNRALGGNTGSYSLVAKLVNLSNGSEELFVVEPEGNWWFEAEPNSLYRAEVGFYAPNRPYFRIVFSNQLMTPRKSPSKRRDYVPAFNITAHQFAEVLNASGYKRDAFEVAIAGDDSAAAHSATLQAYSRFAGGGFEGLAEFEGDELRFVLLALASGYSLEDIRTEISPRLFELLKKRKESLTADQALAALEDNFDLLTEDVVEFEETGPAVFGGSLVNFPRRLKKRAVPRKLLQKLPRFETISSSG